MNMDTLIKRVCEHKPMLGASTIGDVIRTAGLWPEDVVREILTAAAAAVAPAEGLRGRVDAAITRIANGHGAMRIPAEPTDPDLVLAEVLSLLDHRPIPFWLAPKQQPAERVELPVEDAAAAGRAAHEDIERALSIQATAIGLCQAASKGIHTSESCNPDGTYQQAFKFRAMDDLHDFNGAWLGLMLLAKKVAAPTTIELER